MEIDLKLCNFAAEKASLLGACPQQGVGMKVKNKPWHSLIYTPLASVTWLLLLSPTEQERNNKHAIMHPSKKIKLIFILIIFYVRQKWKLQRSLSLTYFVLALLLTVSS